MDKVVFIGNFSGGSFGQQGDPTRTYPYYALLSDIEAGTASREATMMVAFCDRELAEQRLASRKQRAAEEANSAVQIRSARQTKLLLGRQIRAAVEGQIGTPVRNLRWAEAATSKKSLSKQSMSLLRSFPAGGWDVTADGRTFRVWVGPEGRAARVVELSAV